MSGVAIDAALIAVLREENAKLREQVKVLRDKINKYLPECDHYLE